MRNQKIYELLIVDDDELMQMIYKNLFADQLNLSFANNGKAALELAKNKIFDVIITDINMPQMSGLELTKAIRDTENGNKKTIIIGITSTAESIREKALSLGMNEVFSKASDSSTIQNYIKEVVMGQSTII